MAVAQQNLIGSKQLWPKKRPLRFITATGPFDGHDAAINIVRRVLQSSGVEVVHLGHNRIVREIVSAAIQEDVDGIAASSYQGGHMEFYQHLIDTLKENDADSIQVFGGGGGVILDQEIHALHHYGVSRIYSADDGQLMGFQGMIDDMKNRCRIGEYPHSTVYHGDRKTTIWRRLAQTLSAIENRTISNQQLKTLDNTDNKKKRPIRILGVTGTGGSGKSSLVDELLWRLRKDYNDTLKIAIIAIDPSRSKTGGVLLGDRMRMNAINSPNIFMRSMATRNASNEIPQALPNFIRAISAFDFDFVIVETPGIGQGDAGITAITNSVLYVMTSDFGAASQLEKLEMLDYADFVAMNKSDHNGNDDALRDVKKQMQRNRQAFSTDYNNMPVFATSASKMHDKGVDALYLTIRTRLIDQEFAKNVSDLEAVSLDSIADSKPIIPFSRQRYLEEIADTIRSYRQHAEQQSDIAHILQQLRDTKARLKNHDTRSLDQLISDNERQQDQQCKTQINSWPKIAKKYQSEYITLVDRGRPIKANLYHTSCSGTKIPKIALPRYRDHGDLLKWLMRENLPGYFPYTAGVFPLKRQDEEPIRMFAGEGDPLRTNRRFHYLAKVSNVHRLSTAFDSVTLYGADPDSQPDIFGRIGNSGVSVATLDDIKTLYQGFDLCDPNTSVSMTINGPAPIILAMFFNTAIDQQVKKSKERLQRPLSEQECQALKAKSLNVIRGTVQADILKEDQGQNTCLFSTEFSLKMMADVQQYFIDNNIRQFYSVSISGYHIAEAGGNPITQLAFTLANGFTYVEALLARGMSIDDFAHNLSFFFCNGMDAEYSVIGRVARRIWAIAMRDKHGANERSQKLKYHVQTSGRSLHSQAIEYNDIRTTLEALFALYDHCNSLHTNARDEAVTTPTETSVHRAMAIQAIINKEWGLSKNENPNQGSFIIEELTDLVEEGVLQEFERLSQRGGVLGAMASGYQRHKIQDESIAYEIGKQNGSIPIVGINMLKKNSTEKPNENNITRSTNQEKITQIKNLIEFKQRNNKHAQVAIAQLKRAVLTNRNVFAELMSTVRYCSLGQITNALFEVGGQYRRNM